MFRDFYATIAQVLPLLLLALMWDSGYLARLRRQTRLPRRIDPGGVRFWTKPRVRVYSLVVTMTLVAGTATAVLVLAGLLPDGPLLRGLLTGGLVLALGTLITRISVDIVAATSEEPAAGDQPPATAPRPAPADRAPPERTPPH